MKRLALISALLTAACAGPRPIGDIDADPWAPDANKSLPDADPNAPDADPNAPDARPTPDAMPMPDAMSFTPDATPPTGPLAGIVTGSEYSCAIDEMTGRLRCWGYNISGQLGYGHTNAIAEGFNEKPRDAGDVMLGTPVDHMDAGYRHSCIVHSGAVRCWGYNAYGQLGLGNTFQIGDNEVPTVDVNFGTGTATQVATGGYHTCVLLTSGKARCWGRASEGQLGYGNTAIIGDNELPNVAGDVNTGATLTIEQIVAGYYHTCALFTNGKVRCWGEGNYGQLGYASTTDVGSSGTPANQSFVQLGADAKQITAGQYHTCALLLDNSVRCWGRNNYGQLGIGSTSTIGDNEHPDAVAVVDLGQTVKSIKAGGYHTCALLNDDSLRCWGYNSSGQLGVSHTSTIGDNESPSTSPSAGLNGLDVVDFDCGGYHTCAQTSVGEIYCWGDGASGRLGYGNIDNIGDNEQPWDAGPVDVW